MKTRKSAINGLSLLILLLFSCNHYARKQKATVHLNLSTAPPSPVLFAEGIISTPLYQRDLAIHPDKAEIIYTLGDYKQNVRVLVRMIKKGQTWGEPEIMHFSGRHQDIEPFYAADGNRLYFASNRPIFGDSSRSDYNLWYCSRNGDKWGAPQPLDSLINTRGNEFFPSLSNNGNLYFTATRTDGVGREDIFLATCSNGSFQTPVPLPVSINTAYYEFNACVSPDEQVLVFSSYGRPDGLGGGDLYVSEKETSGAWGKARNLGISVNSTSLDYCPFIDWENGIFYFTSERITPQSEKLTNSRQIEELANQALNGFGNIYQVSLDALKLGAQEAKR